MILEEKDQGVIQFYFIFQCKITEYSKKGNTHALNTKRMY